MNQEARLTLVLVNESRRMRESAERVDLVVRAMALRNHIPVQERGAACPFPDLE